MADKGSEFGGVAGRIQPLPHALTAHERARLERAINPTDEGVSVEDMRLQEALAEGRGSLANPDGFTGDQSLQKAVIPGKKISEVRRSP